MLAGPRYQTCHLFLLERFNMKTDYITDNDKNLPVVNTRCGLCKKLYGHASEKAWDHTLPYKVRNYCIVILDDAVEFLELLPDSNSQHKGPYPYVFKMAITLKDKLQGIIFSWYSEIGPTGPSGMIRIIYNKETGSFKFQEFIPEPGTESAKEIFAEVVRNHLDAIKSGTKKQQIICD